MNLEQRFRMHEEKNNWHLLDLERKIIAPNFAKEEILKNKREELIRHVAAGGKHNEVINNKFTIYWTFELDEYPGAQAIINGIWFCRCEDEPERDNKADECVVCGSIKPS